MKINELEISKVAKLTRNPLDIIHQSGWNLLGTGIEGAVAMHPNKPYALKIFDYDSKYIDFVRYVQEHQNNPYLPRFSRYVRPVPGSKFSYVRMELLDHVPGYSMASIEEWLYQHFPSEFVYLDLQGIKQKVEINHFREDLINALLAKCEKSHNLNINTNSTPEFLQCAGYKMPDQNWIQLVSDLFAMYKDKGWRRLDLHGKNVMLRNNKQLVVTDPIYK